MLKRYFISNITLMVLLNFLVKPVWVFAIDRNVQNVVGNESYGMFAALLSLSIIFNILLDLGITNFNNKSLAEDTKRVGAYLPNMLIAKGVLSMFYMGVILLIALALNYGARSVTLLSLIALIQLLNSLLLFLRSNVSAHHDFKIDSVLSIADKFIMIGICGVLLFTPEYRQNFKIEWFIYAQLIAYGISILGALFVVIFRYSKISLARVELALVKRILKQSLPYAALILLMGIYMRSDSVLLERLLPEDGDTQNGLYMTAFRILDALNMFGFLFAGMLLPMFSRLFSKNNNIAGLVKTTVNILMPVSLVILANALFFNHDIMDYLYDNNTLAGSEIYRLVMMSLPAYCIMYIYSTLLTAKGSLKLLIKIAAVACLLSVGGNFILIPTYKAFSVSWVAIGVHWFVAIAHIMFSIRESSITFKWAWLSQFIFFFLAFCLINYSFKALDINLWLSILFNILIFIPLVFVIKLWDWKDLTKYFQEIIVKDKG